MGFRESAACVKFRDSPVCPKVGYEVLKLATLATGGTSTPENGPFRIPRDSHPEVFIARRSGSYEQAETIILQDEFEPDDLIVEVGSNIGYTARRASSELKPKESLACVEANSDVRPDLESNRAEVRRTHDIRIVSAAIGAPEREGQLKGFHRRNDLCSGLGEVLTTDGKFTENGPKTSRRNGFRAPVRPTTFP